MGRQVDIAKTFTQVLNTANTSGYAVQYPNAPIDKPTDAVWLRMTYLPNQPQQVVLGDNGLDRMTGVVQIDVFAPRDQGALAALTAVDEFADGAFKSGTIYNLEGVNVRIQSSGMAQGSDPTWYHKIINVEFIVYLPR